MKDEDFTEDTSGKNRLRMWSIRKKRIKEGPRSEAILTPVAFQHLFYDFRNMVERQKAVNLSVKYSLTPKCEQRRVKQCFISTFISLSGYRCK